MNPILRCAAFILATLVCGGCTHHADLSREVATNVALATAQSGTIDVTVRGIGRVGASAGSETKLAFATAGRIGAIDVHVGQRVAAGETLATLDTQPLALAAEQADADARAASAQAVAASVDRTTTRIAVDRAAVQRAQRLFDAGVDARKDVEAAQAQLAADAADAQASAATRAAAAASAQSASARAALARRDLDNGALRSPLDGVVTAVYHLAGESVDPTVNVVAVAPGDPRSHSRSPAWTPRALLRAIR